MSSWVSIDQAPKDGSPIWARGWDWGKPDTTRHYGWFYWEEPTDDLTGWKALDCSYGAYLTDFMPAAFVAQG